MSTTPSPGPEHPLTPDPDASAQGAKDRARKRAARAEHREDEQHSLRGILLAGGALALVLGGTVTAFTVLSDRSGESGPLPGSGAATPVSQVELWEKEATDHSRGAAALGSRSPQPPAGALYVDAQARPGGDGSENAPFTTIAEAVRTGGAGATIVLRAGTYHEQVNLIDTPEAPRGNMTIQSYPGEEVWLDGSREATWHTEDGRAVIDWTDNDIWNDWQSFGERDETGDLAVVGEQNPVAADPTEVWVGDTRLWQVPADPGPGEFSVERGQRRDAKADARATIILGAPPAEGEQVRVAALGQAIVGKAPNLTLTGFGVRGYATPVNWMGTVFLQAESPVVRDMVFEDLPAIPLFLSDSENALVENVTVIDAGLQGISAVHCDGATFRANRIEGANFQLFNSAPIAGGMKVGQMSTFVITDTLVADTHEATGLWVDESGTDFALTDNLITRSGRNGIQVEISGRAVVAGNVVLASQETGIQVYAGEKVTVANNLVAASGSRGGAAGNIAVLQDQRRAAEGGMGVDSRGTSTGLSWITEAITVEGNILAVPDPAARAQIVALDHTGQVSADDMDITVTHNVLVDALPTSSGNGTVPTAWWRAGEDLVLQDDADAEGRVNGWSDNTEVRPQDGSQDIDALISQAAVEVDAPVSPQVAEALGINPGTSLVGPPSMTAR